MAKKKAATVTKKSTKTKTAKKGKVKTVTTTTVTTTTQTVVPVQTKVAFVIDESGSMNGIRQETVNMFNSLLRDIRDNDPTAEITVVHFGGSVRTVMANVGLSQIRELNINSYYPAGMTPLFDGVGEAIEKMGDDPDAAYLVYVVTDGGENSSTRLNKDSFSKLIREKQNTDRYTIAFCVPPGEKDIFVEISGVSPGNVKEWEASARGLQNLQHSNTYSVGNYYATRATGQRATKTLFDIDLSNVKVKDFNSLPDVTSSFRMMTVDKEQDIKSFVESKGEQFRLGSAFYSLSKKEEISPQKELLISKRGEKTLKANARDLLNLPSGDVRVNPKNFSEYEIFVQSTSNNRKLVRGTRLAYKTS